MQKKYDFTVELVGSERYAKTAKDHFALYILVDLVMGLNGATKSINVADPKFVGK